MTDLSRHLLAEVRISPMFPENARTLANDLLCTANVELDYRNPSRRSLELLSTWIANQICSLTDNQFDSKFKELAPKVIAIVGELIRAKIAGSWILLHAPDRSAIEPWVVANNSWFPVYECALMLYEPAEMISVAGVQWRIESQPLEDPRKSQSG